MKLATWNIQGLGQYGKWVRLWRWVVRNQLDLVAIQEHKKHDHAGMLLHTKDFQLCYNGIKDKYSGCLLIVRKNVDFAVLFDDPQGRFIVSHLMLRGISYVCINVYAPSSPVDRVKTWKDLALSIQHCMTLQIWENARILLCGDFNMVDSDADCTTSSSVISYQESSIWREILNMLNCRDLWGYIGGHTLRFTYYSRSHKKAMRRLDRCYYSQVSALSGASKMWVDATMLLSYYNPLLVSLIEVDWNSCIPFNLPRIPLRVNHSWMQISLFRSKMQSLIQHVLSLRVSACMKWEFLVVKLQDVIRECGITFSRILNAAKYEARQCISHMAERVDLGHLLSHEEYAQFCKAYKCLELIENQAIKSSKVRARCTQVNDLQANSKCFFEFLRFKHVKDMISHLEVNGSIVNDGNAIASVCSEHFRNLFAASYKSDDAWFEALHASLAYTPHLLDSQMVDSCEKAICEEEVYMALQSLKNGKAPGLDGITKEFVMAFWPLLKNLVLDVCNEIWKDKKMPYSFKMGKIKLIPKIEVPRRIGDWRPITMMSIIYKIFAKVFALRLKCIIHKIVHPSQIGFVHQRSIYDNILLTQILIEYTSKIGMQIDFEKPFDLIRWDFIAVVLKKLGFGVRFSRLIYTLAQDSASQVELNGRLSVPFPIERSVRQGCPLSPLFYALASSPIFYLLDAKMNSQRIHGISLYGIQQIAVGFADDTFSFAKAERENIRNILDSLAPFSTAFALKINMKKSAIINISAQNFQAIEWEGPKIESGVIFRHLGYPLGVGVPIKDKVDWVMHRVKYKMDKWFVSQWPLHARVRIVQAFMKPYVMYYLLLLDWKKNQLHIFDRLIKAFPWSKRHNRALVLSSWEYVCRPKDKGGLGILNLRVHLMARRTAFIMRIVSSHAPLWAPLLWKFVENAEVKFKGTWKLDVWNKFFSHAPLQTSSHTINILFSHFKSTLATLRWNGRQCYVGNSLALISPYWSFLSNPPIALSLGAAGRYFNNKGIDSVAKYYDSKWEILPFSVLRKTYAL
ncbi:hypothetical protein KP509_03G000300 [Ceratopteris richardii]|uniref:Reverse transcriptase domain-containing protein n=1 Tax=Ceratopteris richardii TaxID=49495 RepID=A0A8T2V0S2_CERRI|nr:hypothetical protein KP509_03G000300 [Ceratopteris richardii]